MKKVTNQPTPEMITEAGRRAALILNLKFVLWDLVNETRADVQGPYDVMPYIKRIRQIFEKK